MKIELQELNQGDEFKIIIGDIQLSAYLVKGKTVIKANCISNGDFMLVQPDATNSIVLKADKTIKR